MKHVVSFSGGRTSAYLVHLLKQKELNEGWNIDYLFFDTHAEHPKTYEFIRRCVEHFDLDLKVFSLKINPELGQGNEAEQIGLDQMGWDMSLWYDMTKKYGNTSVAGAYCTREMKTNLMNKYTKQFDEYTNWIGIRADEKRRLRGHPNIRYLAEISPFEKHDVIGWWRQMPFDLEIQEHLGNCVFCIKKSVPKIALAIMDEPELFKEWNDMITNGEVREKVIDRPKDAIYRGVLSAEGIAHMYADYDRDELHMSMKHARKYEAGACTESCEVFGDQMDMFEDVSNV